MRHTFHAVASRVLFWLTAAISLPGASAIGADAEIVFDPPKAVVVRQTNGAPARGDLLRIDNAELHLRALNGNEVQFKLERVRSVKTADETFEFWPSQETFEELAGRINTIGGAKLTGRVPKSAANDESETPPQGRGRAARKHQQNVGDDNVPRDEDGRGPFGIQVPATNPADSDQTPVTRADNARPATDAEPEPAESTDEPAVDPEAGTEILVCSNCQKDLPTGFASGDKCPHCNKVAVFDTGDVNPFAATGSSAPAQNPFAANGAAPPAAAIPAAAPAAAAAAPVTADAEGSGLAEIPLYGKIGIFAAFLVVGWLILQRR
ncbi:MAG: hypothetical protein JNG89_14355 [Planctomycetaceae bacterium]|nr:hypothetical protein [Planctomycetaceae bacterium]